ncbi:type II toxin-antitoxin system MqsR family toxin [Legionella sp. CNM-4043-24]|uniref:type II toxin-antitoxin system MqsR family toxin n=1 Tax=Legionella sp. CNM-4043-24 TaxID=3421646 RepID=UPI00403AE551
MKHGLFRSGRAYHNGQLGIIRIKILKKLNIIVNAIQALTRKNFYKSMPPYNLKFSAWQDVYRSRFQGFDLYIKFQINENNELLLSFKESQND